MTSNISRFKCKGNCKCEITETYNYAPIRVENLKPVSPCVRGRDITVFTGTRFVLALKSQEPANESPSLMLHFAHPE